MPTLAEQPAPPRGGAIRRTFTYLSRDRSRRVIVLIIGVIVLSIGDLIVTVGHLKTVGMIEANPIAAWLIRSTNSPVALVAYKLCTVGICAALLYRVRRHLEGEIAAWCALAILAGMSIMWHGYSEQFDSPEDVHLAQVGLYRDNWLILD